MSVKTKDAETNRQYKSSVFANLLGEWNMEDAKAVWKEEGIQIGEQRGEQRGMQQIFTFLSNGHSLEEAKKKFAFA